MKFGSLFSGIGGIDLGLELAGMECAWQVEIDEFCQQVLSKHWPEVPKYRDIREVGIHNLEHTDLIAGGFPCQPFSNAGEQRGAADNRHLWPEMFRVIKELRPSWVLGENVTGIVGLALDTVLSDLENEGYTTRAFVIPACGVGAWHQRDRVWIVANSHGVWELQPQGSFQELRRRTSDIPKENNAHRWAAEPNVARMVHGIPNRVDRIKCLGNAVVPQVVAEIGRAILKCS
jgi:DNA (cytosine-5)-methyltransferase 1